MMSMRFRLIALAGAVSVATSLSFGMTSAPTQAPPLTEAERIELRALIKLIPDGHVFIEHYNPLVMIKAVNALRPLGKDEAIHLIEQSHTGGGELIGRFLFDPPKGETHPMMYAAHKELLNSEWSMYPSIEIEGVPLHPLLGFAGSGGFPPDREYLDWYRAHGTIRAEPLRPNDDPLLVWRAWLDSDQRAKLGEQSPRSIEQLDRIVARQMLLLVETVYPRTFDLDTVNFRDLLMIWDDAQKALRDTDTRWDVDLNCYVRADDGSYITPIQERDYRLFRWTMPIEGLTAELHVQRISETVIWVMANKKCTTKGDVPDVRVRLYDADDPSREIDTFEIDGEYITGYWNTSRNVELAKGANVRATLLQNGKEIARSPIMFVDREAEQE